MSKNVKELHSNFVNFSKCDGDIKYMTLTDLLSLLKKNELEKSILEIETQRLVILNIYECICGDNGDLQDLSIQCLPYVTIQFNLEEIISLSLKLCKHLQNDLPSKKDEGEEKYNNILRQCIVITNSIKSMCKSNNLLIQLSQQNNTNNKIPTPHLMSNTNSNNSKPLTDSPLLLPKTQFTSNEPKDDDNKAIANNDDENTITNENITQLIQSLSSLLLNIIASKQQSMKIAFEKHIKKQQQLLLSNTKSNSGSIQNEIIISFEHYHEQILFALDILSTIIDNHGKNVSFIFDSATNVLLQLLSGAHHDYSDQSKNKNNNNNNKLNEEIQTTGKKLLESKKVNKKAIECLGSLSRFLPNNELTIIIDTLCETIIKCEKNQEYSTLKNLFNAINTISNDQAMKQQINKAKDKNNGNKSNSKGLSFRSVKQLCFAVINVISNENIKGQIEVREYGFMALETLIKNSSSSNIISLFPQFLPVISDGLKYDPNWVSLAKGDGDGDVSKDEMDVDEDDDNKQGAKDEAEEEENTGWTDDDDDSWGNNDDDDDGFTNDLGDDEEKKDPDQETEDGLEDIEQLDELNQNLDDDDDDSWKVRRSSNKCLLAMIDILMKTERDFNPNMYRLIIQDIINKLLLLLNRRLCERILRIQMNVFETYNTLLKYLNNLYVNSSSTIYITINDQIIEKICQQIADKEYINEVLMGQKLNKPEVYEAFFNVLSNILRLYGYNNKQQKSPQFIASVLPLCISTMSNYKVKCIMNEKWNGAITSAFRCCTRVYGSDNMQTDKAILDKIFKIGVDINNGCNSNDILEAMFECIGVATKQLDNESQQILLKQCISRLRKTQQQQNVVNSTALCLTSLLSLNNEKNNSTETLIIGMDLGDQLMSHEKTRYTGIKLSICCIKSMINIDKDGDALFNELYEKSKIKSIIQQFSQFLKQNSLDVRFLSLRGLLLSFNKYDKLINEFQLSLPDIISLLKNLFDHQPSSFSTESYTKLNNFLSVIIHLFSSQCSLYDKDMKSLFDIFTIPLLESVTNSNAIHPSLFPLWINLFASIGQKLNNLCDNNYKELISYLNTLHDKLIRSNMILSTPEAKFQSCSCAASLFNQFITVNNSELENFLTKLTEHEEQKNDNDDDGDNNMEPVAYNNTAIVGKEINRILISQLLSMNDGDNNDNKIIGIYKKYTGSLYKECLECKTEINEDGSTYIVSCYLLSFINDSNKFLNSIKNLSENQAQFTLNVISKVIEGIEIMNKKKGSKDDIVLLKGEPLQNLIKFTQQFCGKYFNQSATVISHLLCNNVSQKETFNIIIKWIEETEIENSSRLGMESLTSALITSVGISNQLSLNTFSELIKPAFIQKVISLINNKDLKISLSALKNIKFLILARIENAIKSKEMISKLLLILLDRTKASKDYIEKIQLGPITKEVDKSASVRSLAFEVITDIIEYNNDYIIENNEFINLCTLQLMDALKSDDPNLVNYACQLFQILIRSGYVTSKDIKQELIECINTEIQNCKGDENNNSNNNKMDNNKKEKLGYLLQLFGNIRKSVSEILSLNYITDGWNSISSLMNQIEHNPSFLTRTPSMIYNENMDIGQPLLLSPSLRSHSISSLQRQNSLQYLEPVPVHTNNQNNGIYTNHTSHNSNSNIDMIDID